MECLKISNGLIKSYWTKNAILTNIRVIFTHLTMGLTTQNFPRPNCTEFSLISMLLMCLESFRKIKWRDQYLWEKYCYFGHLRLFFTLLIPRASKQEFSQCQGCSIHMYINVIYIFWKLSVKSNEGFKICGAKWSFLPILGNFAAFWQLLTPLWR